MRPSHTVSDDKHKQTFKKSSGPDGAGSLRKEIVVVGGWRPSDKPGRAFSSLLFGVFEGEKLRYRGRVGSGFDKADQDKIFRDLKSGERKVSPFLDAPRDAARAARWTTPSVVIEVRYAELTEEGYFRHPTFVAICEDVDVAGEAPADDPDEASDARGPKRRQRRRPGR